MTAIVLVGHGSQTTGVTADAVYAHADRLQSRDVFQEVDVAFWKETPWLRQVLRRVESNHIVVVPMMMSKGYFVDDVFPRELRLTASQTLDADKAVWYAEPIGTHAQITTAIENRVRSVMDHSADPAEFGVAIVGHGTEQHEESSTTTYTHAARFQDKSDFAEVHAFFLDESPHVSNISEYFEVGKLIVVPLFIANGTHTTVDIPDALGIQYDSTPQVGQNDTQIWYSGAVGTEPVVTNIAIDLATTTLTTHSPTSRPDSNFPPDPESDVGELPITAPNEVQQANEAFISFIAPSTTPSSDDQLRTTSRGYRAWGEAVITLTNKGDATYSIRHHHDLEIDSASLDTIKDTSELRDRIRYTETGEYRPLRSATTLPTGWIVPALNRQDIPRIIDVLYPGSIIDWHREQTDRLERERYLSITEQYTGIYSSTSHLQQEDVATIKSECCAQCVKQPVWQREDEAYEPVLDNEEIPCPEPCAVFIETARQQQESEPTIPSRGCDDNQPSSHTERPAPDEDAARFDETTGKAGPRDVNT